MSSYSTALGLPSHVSATGLYSATALIWKLLTVAEKRFRKLDAPHLLRDVFEGRKFEDGKPVSTKQRREAA